MKKILALLGAVLLAAVTVSAQSVTFDGKADVDAGVAGFPVTATISKVEFTRDGLAVDFDKRNGPNRWPDVVPEGWGGPIQFSLGLALRVNGQFYASAPVEFWNDAAPSQAGPLQDQSLTCETGTGHIHCNWFYAADRWPHLSQAHPVAGDKVGVFVVSGSVRNNAYKVKERSDIVWVTLPAPGQTAVFTFDSAPVPQTPEPIPVPPVDESLAQRLDRLDHEVGILAIALDEIRKAVQGINEDLVTVAGRAIDDADRLTKDINRIDAALAAHPLFTDCKVSAFGFSLHCDLVP